MNKTKLWKIAMPALLASALVFETMPGSVREYTAAESGITTVSANFFTVQSQHPAVMCLPLAGTLTMAVLILALVAAFSKKNGLLKAVYWISLAAATLTAVPYMMQSEGISLQPNVIVTTLLFAVWFIAWMLERKGRTGGEKAEEGRRLA